MNYLGKILMQVRKELREEAKKKETADANEGATKRKAEDSETKDSKKKKTKKDK